MKPSTGMKELEDAIKEIFHGKEVRVQKYRADRAEKQQDGASVWYADWMGGATVSRINECRCANLLGPNGVDMRSTVYVTGEADTFFSIPAVTSIKGCRVRGYVTGDDGNLVFHHTYY